MKKRYALALVPLLLGGGGYWFAFIPASATPTGEQSQKRFAPGPYTVLTEDFEVVDPSRPTQRNHEYPGRQGRALKGKLWRPDKLTQPGPLVVYSHGFLSFHTEGLYLVRFLVSHGYTVVAVDYPLTNWRAPGKPLVTDVVNQPADVSFLITTLLARNAATQDVLHGTLDPSRIAVAGVSLGGLTSTLVAFHKKVKDPRIAAAVSIAGPTAGVMPSFFGEHPVPFLMIGGEADAIVPYAKNAAPIPLVDPGSILVTLKDASHAGFAHVAATLMRFADNPDVRGCEAVMGALQNTTGDSATLLPGLDGVDNGIDSKEQVKPCVAPPLPVAMTAARQHMFTTLATHAFLESLFADDPAARSAAREYLLHGLGSENSPEVRVSGG